MPRALTRLLHRLHRLADAPDPASDALLLERFARDRDEAAFAALLARHGSMVYHTCRRALVDAGAAEDAFQATFLILARKAGSLRRPAALAGWLHGVALRVAVKARRLGLRLRARQGSAQAAEPVDPRREPLDELTGRELLAALDEEVERLPEEYRLPVLSCCIEGLSQEEAARRLGCTPGSVKGRLERGRRLLHLRLARRGLTLPAVLAANEVLRATVRAGLAGATARAAVALSVGGPGAGCGVQATAQALARRVVQGAGPGKGKLLAVLALTFGMAALGAGITALHQPQMPPGEGEGKEAGANPPTAAGAALRTDVYGDRLPSGALARLGTIRFRHGDDVCAVLYSPDGKTLVSGSHDGTAGVWDAATGKRLRLLELGHQKPVDYLMKQVHHVAFSADGRLLMTGSRNMPIRLWDAASGKPLATFGEPPKPYTAHDCRATLSPDGKILACGLPGRLRLWDVPSGNELLPLQAPAGRGAMGKFWRLAFSPDSELLATLSDRGMLALREPTTGRLLRACAGDEGSPALGLVFSPKGDTLAAALGNTVRVWDVATGVERHRLVGHPPGQGGFVKGLAYSPDGKVLASGSADSTICLWDLAAGKELRRCHTRHIAILSLAFAPDGKTLASGGSDNVIRLWDSATGQERSPHHGHQSAVNTAVFSRDGHSLLSAGADGTLRRWDLASAGERYQVKTFPPPEYWPRLTLSPDGSLVAGGGYAETVRLHDTASGKALGVLGGVQGPVAFTPAGGLLACVGVDNRIELWDAVGRRRVRVFEAATSTPCYLACSPDGRLVAAGDNHGQLSLWDVTTGKEVRRMGRGSSIVVAFAADGRTVAGANPGPNSLHLWEVATGKERAHLEHAGGRSTWVTAAAFAPDGRAMVTGTAEGTVYLWDLARGEECASLAGHLGSVNEVSFAPDGKRFASAGMDTTVLIWDADRYLRRVSGKSPVLSGRELHALLGQLGGEDAAAAYRALWRLVASQEQAVSLLGAQLRPIPLPDAPQRQRIERLIDELNSSRFAVRDTATRQLLQIGEAAVPALRGAAATAGLETRRRLEMLLARLDGPTPSGEALRAVRAVEVLESVGTAEARRLLAALAAGAPGTRLTREAQASLKRLNESAR